MTDFEYPKIACFVENLIEKIEFESRNVKTHRSLSTLRAPASRSGVAVGGLFRLPRRASASPVSPAHHTQVYIYRRGDSAQGLSRPQRTGHRRTGDRCPNSDSLSTSLGGARERREPRRADATWPIPMRHGAPRRSDGVWVCVPELFPDPVVRWGVYNRPATP